MISNKKSYAMKMLQLALALSLLHVDPSDIYLQQRLRSWDAQLDLHGHGDGWELEMLRTVPIIESQHPYGNRKMMPPLIEDLLRFDELSAYKLPTSGPRYNVTAYVLNVHNDSNSSVQTAALQELQSNNAVGSTVNTGSTSSAPQVISSAANVAASSTGATATSSNGFTADTRSIPSPNLEIFLNLEQFQDQRSIWEQNLADLQDYGDFPITNPYANLPLKDGQQNTTCIDFSLDQIFHGLTANGQDTENAAALNDSTPHPNGASLIKSEQYDNDEYDDSLLYGLFDDLASCSNGVASCVDKQNETHPFDREPQPDLDEAAAIVEIKTEETTEPDESEAEGATAASIAIKLEADATNQSSDFSYDIDLSSFIDVTLFDEEESEIVEVLWKQDVDLGYSLNQEQLLNSSVSNGGDSFGKFFNGSSEAEASNDDIEKLKALEELKDDNPKNDDDKNDEDDDQDDIDNEWEGIPFTIDNETGEPIRLPLDELLNDVLQLAELAGATEEADYSTASTSRAAAAAAGHNNNRCISETDKDFKKTEDIDNGDNAADIDFDDLQNNSSLASPLFDLDDEARKELDDLDKMLQSSASPYHHAPHPHHVAAAHHHHAAAAAAVHAHHQRAAAVGGTQPPSNYASVGSGPNSAFHRQSSSFHHGHHQGRMPLSRSVSMEQRLQDIATFFNPLPSMSVADMPPYHHPYPSHHYSYQGAAAAPMPASQHVQYATATAPPPPPPPHHGHHDLFTAAGTQPHYGHNLGSAVSSSMHLTNATHHDSSDVAGAASNAYKMEHDMMYYSNASSDINHTTEGFINSILNDEDLHLMDMNVTDPYFRMVDNSTSNNSSVLGLSSSGHGSSAGTGSGASTGNTVALTMSAANGGTTADLLGGGGANGGGGGNGQTNGGDRLDASSDSAVSSMGSERVPSLSDGEWGEGSDSAQDYHQGKYGGPYDYSYNNSTRITTVKLQPPVAQKKHQMFGKRYQHEQNSNPGTSVTVPPSGSVAPPTSAQLCNGNTVPQPPVHPIKYEYEQYPNVTGLHQQLNSNEPGAVGGVPNLVEKEQQHHHHSSSYGLGGNYSLDYSVRMPRTPHDIVQHNHTYNLPQGSGSLPRPQQRDKKHGGTVNSKSGKSAASIEDEHLTRDEKRARALDIPITVSDIINLPMDEFNERLSKYDLNENQLSLIRDIRRRGKNKVAAQNCRKRKLDQILTLEDEVNAVRKRKDQLSQERDMLSTEHRRIMNKFAQLHKHVFQYLRDPEGNPCSTSDYSLQQAADGSIYLLPRDHKADGGSNATVASGAVAAPNNHNSNNNNGMNHHNGNGGTSAGATSLQHGHMSSTSHTHHQQQHVAAATAGLSQRQQPQQQHQQQQHHQTRRQHQQQQTNQPEMHYSEYQHHPTQQKE